MLGNLASQSEDAIIKLMDMYANDPRSDKVDLGVGVYKNANGITPIFKAIRTAEKRLWEEETTKTYTGLAGDPSFARAMRGLILGAGFDTNRVAGATTAGGTSAVHHALELVQMENPNATVWYSEPTWPNHISILEHLKIKARSYRYFDAVTCAVDFEGMMSDLDQVREGDVVLLHGCCHNPTGANLNIMEWKAVADLLIAKDATPLIDIAYQGFGDGLDADAAATRWIASNCPETLIAASCSKNFGIYRERTGVLLAVASNARDARKAQSTLSHLNRLNYSFPPDHGARMVTMILEDAALRSDWAAELEKMRVGMLELRTKLATELRRLTGSDRFGFIGQHRGMFSLIGATPKQVEVMREEHAIYMVGDSRMNIAGLNDAAVPILAKAIVAVVK